MPVQDLSITSGRPEDADEIPDLVHSTAASVYDYLFAHSRPFFDAFIRASWGTPGSLCSDDQTSVARAGARLLGIEVGYGSDHFYDTGKVGGQIMASLIRAGEATPEQARHAGLASYKNDFQLPRMPADAYYVLALANRPEARGVGAGRQLLQHAIDRAREAGYRTLHLDVLSDNPAVGFYERMGLVCMAETRCPELNEKEGIPMEKRMVLSLR